MGLDMGLDMQYAKIGKGLVISFDEYNFSTGLTPW